MSDRPEFKYKIGLLAPSRVGKSTLIASMLDEGQRMLASSAVSLRTADAVTSNKLAATHNTITGALRARTFEPGRVPSTQDPLYYRLRLEPRGEETPILFDILDYPGGWLENSGGDEHQDRWLECGTFLAKCTILIVPIDSVLLMEAGAVHRNLLPLQLAMFQIQQVVRDWARHRAAQPGEPALAVFAPVKCETYHADNGGLSDQARLLRDAVGAEYEEVICAIREEAPRACIRYLPIDTFGCVELTSARWKSDPQAPGGHSLHPKYLVRAPWRVQTKGMDDLIGLLSQHLVEAAQMQGQWQADAARTSAIQSRKYAELREGLFRDLWLQVSGRRAQRLQDADQDQIVFEQTTRTATTLAEVLAALADRTMGERLGNIT